MDKLLLNTCESFYWIGYILADGRFGKYNRLTVSCVNIEHIEKLKKYIGLGSLKYTPYKDGVSTKNDGIYTYRIHDAKNGKKIVEKFKINSPKLIIHRLLKNGALKKDC
jgi:DNA-binding transcriptional regulator WhiA